MSALAETAVLTLEEPLKVKVSRAQSLILKKDSTWSLVGELPQGKVLKPLDQIVVINSFNVYEGYIVVNDDALVGFYLPVTDGFVEVDPTVITLVTQEE